MKNVDRIAKELSGDDWVLLMIELINLADKANECADSPSDEEKIDFFFEFCSAFGKFCKTHQQLINRISGMSDVLFKKESDNIWITCSQCRQTVVANDSGVCLSCQGAYEKWTQPDSWENIHNNNNIEDLE